MKLAVVLFNLGGPDSLKAVKPFLFNLFRDRAIIGLPALARYPLAALIATTREKTAQANYAVMGGASPLLSTANGLPQHVVDRDDHYRAQVQATAEAIAAA